MERSQSWPMRLDRIIVGECRGGEAFDMLQAMNTGHDRSTTTLHANTPRDALSRLETMIMRAGFELPVKAIRQQISSAIDLVIQVSRLQGGVRFNFTWDREKEFRFDSSPVSIHWDG
jgi:pilus assembly protein CpaF